MDEIQDCIADCQFGEVLRERDNTKPSARIPVPPPGFDPEEYAQSRGIDFEGCLTQPVGVYILSKEFPEAKTSHEFLFELEQFKRMENPGLRDFIMLLEKARSLPSKYKETVNELAMRLHTNVLPSLQSTPSMGRMLMADRNSTKSKAAEDTPDETAVGSLGLSELNITAVSDDQVVVSGIDDEVDEKEEEITKKRMSISKHRAQNREEAIAMFDNLKDALMEQLKPNWKKFRDTEGFERLMNVLWYCEQPVDLESFNIFRDLGRGAFGVVSGAKFRATGSLVALKCMNKKLVKGKNALKLVRAEKEVLAKLGERPSHFTVFLQYSFQDKETYYLALPLCTGGDLQYHLAQEKYFNAERARFHIAEVVLGVAHLHSLGILYRDLKPDNILIDEEGHCRISDMGLAIVTNGKSLRGRAGTPGYWPPEMIQKKRYSYPADWWSLGCVLYEMLSGRCPFSKLNTRMERDEATLNWEVTFPDKLGCGMGGEKTPFPEDAKKFIAKLLDRDKNNRLGASERGADDVKDDPYFAPLNWSKLSRREVTPPWVPRKEAIHAFNQSDIDGRSNEHDYRKLKLTPKDEVPDFSYTSTLVHQHDIVTVLKMDDEGKLGYLDKKENLGCCLIA